MTLSNDARLMSARTWKMMSTRADVALMISR